MEVNRVKGLESTHPILRVLANIRLSAQCKRSGCSPHESQNSGGKVGGKKSSFYSKMPALRSDSGLPVTDCLPALTTAKSFIDRPGGAKQKKE